MLRLNTIKTGSLIRVKQMFNNNTLLLYQKTKDFSSMTSIFLKFSFRVCLAIQKGADSLVNESASMPKISTTCGNVRLKLLIKLLQVYICAVIM